MSKIIISKCDNYNSEKIYKILAGNIAIFNNLELFAPKKKILLKPNLLAAHFPKEAATTHPEFLRAVIWLVKEKDAVPIVADGPSVTNFDEVVTKTGIKEVCKQENVELINLNTYPSIKVEFKKYGIEHIVISKLVTEVDRIINLPKLKTHSLVGFTCAVKNMYGIVPGLTKSLYHRQVPHPKDFVDLMFTIFSIRMPDLTIVDGIYGMDGEGPAGGNVKKFNVIIMSTDAVAIDSFVLQLITKDYFKIYKKFFYSVKPEVVFYNTTEKFLQNINIVPPKTTQIVTLFPTRVLNFAKHFIWFRPKIVQQRCERCGKCYNICPQKTIYVLKGKYVISYKNCISCFCCYEACPYKAIKFEYSFWSTVVIKIKSIIKKVF